MNDSATDQTRTKPSRRAVVAGAAWSVPGVLVVAAAPAYAASGAFTLTATNPTADSFSEDTAASRSVAATLKNNGAVVTGDTVTFTLSDISWLALPLGLATNNSATDGSGVATVQLTAVPGSTPIPGATVTLTATSNGVTISWIITYRPFAALAGGAHNLALDAFGKVYAWGYNGTGGVGDGTFTTPRASPVAVQTPAGNPMAGKTILAISAGVQHSLALDNAGNVYTWGLNDEGQLGNGGLANNPVPALVSTPPGNPMAGKFIIGIEAGSFHSLARDIDGNVYAWGINFNGQLGDAKASGARSMVPVAVIATAGKPMAGKKIVALAAGEFHNLAVADDGTLYGWGRDLDGELGDAGNGVQRLEPVLATAGALAGRKIVEVAAGSVFTFARDENNVVIGFGTDGVNNLGVGRTPAMVATLVGKSITALSAGHAFALALDSDGIVYAWGRGFEGQLGNGVSSSGTSSANAVITAGTPMAGKTTVKILAASQSSYALSQDGLTFAWGGDGAGNLGNGTVGTNALLPVKVNVAP